MEGKKDSMRIGKSYVVNAVSLNMLAENAEGFRIVERHPEVEADQVYFSPEKGGMDWFHFGFSVPALGHLDTATVVAKKFGLKVEQLYGRVSHKCEPGDRILVFQYQGPRLPEGSTELPEGARIVAFLVEVF